MMSHSDMLRMNKISFLALCLFLSTISSAAFATSEIVDVHRNITLSDDETPTKDFYIKIDGASLKKNLVIKAVRKVTVKDSSQKAVGDFKTVVGLLKVIHVEGAVAVAREFKLLPRTELPMLEQIGIMSGDEIDLSDSFTDTSKPHENKKKVAELAQPEAGDARVPAATETPNPAVTAPQNIKPNSITRDI